MSYLTRRDPGTALGRMRMLQAAPGSGAWRLWIKEAADQLEAYERSRAARRSADQSAWQLSHALGPEPRRARPCPPIRVLGTLTAPLHEAGQNLGSASGRHQRVSWDG